MCIRDSNKIAGIDFNALEDRHLFGDLYEKILRDLQSAGNAGEYYTPRAVTQFMVDMTDPQLGQVCLLYTSPSPRDRTRSRMPSSA